MIKEYMSNNITNLYKIKQKSDYIIKCDNIKISNKIKCYKKSTFRVYVYGELYLYIDSVNNKKCYHKENLKNTIHDGKFFIERSKLVELPLENFPFIDKYDQIIDQTVFTYIVNDKSKNKIEINHIKESNINTPEKEVSYINSNSDVICIQDIIFFIE